MMNVRWYPLVALFVFFGCRNGEVQTYRLAKEPAGQDPHSHSPGDGHSHSNDPQMPEGHPPIDGQSGSSMAPMPGMAMPDESSRKNISWKVPAGWVEKPASQMRVGNFQVPGKDGRNSDISVVPLGGSAGGDIDNINRWRGQINLDPLSEAELPKVMQKLRAGSRGVSYVSMASKDPLLEKKHKARIMTAWFKEAGQIWFIKMTGEDADVEAAKPSFLEFVGSIKVKQ